MTRGATARTAPGPSQPPVAESSYSLHSRWQLCAAGRQASCGVCASDVRTSSIRSAPSISCSFRCRLSARCGSRLSVLTRAPRSSTRSPKNCLRSVHCTAAYEAASPAPAEGAVATEAAAPAPAIPSAVTVTVALPATVSGVGMGAFGPGWAARGAGTQRGERQRFRSLQCAPKEMLIHCGRAGAPLSGHEQSATHTGARQAQGGRMYAGRKA